LNHSHITTNKAASVVCSNWMFEHCQQQYTVKPLILVTLNFGVWVNLIILDPVILVFLLPTTLKRYCIQIFVACYFCELARLAK